MIEEILKIENISFDIPTKNKVEVISELVDLMYNSSPDFDKDSVKQSLMMRELKGSTGIGNHIAVPHAKVEGINKIMISVGIFKNGIDFESVDGKPVYLVFCIVMPQNIDSKLHLGLLKEIVSKYERLNLKEVISSLSSPADFYNTLTAI
jgi:mannitol/fructose-specific phosphotransferase system IIA component (Ntr-type)